MLSPQRLNMNTPVLTIEERPTSSRVPGSPNFLLRCAKRSWRPHGAPRRRRRHRSAHRGTPALDWIAVAIGRGAREFGVAVGQAGHADLRRARHLVRRHRALRRPAAHARRERAHGETTLLIVRKGRFQGLGAARRALRRAAAPELPSPAPDVRPVEDLNTPAGRAAGQAGDAAGAPLRRPAGRGDPHRPAARQEDLRSCWAPRASASTRSSRASSARARCASSRRAWWCSQRQAARHRRR